MLSSPIEEIFEKLRKQYRFEGEAKKRETLKAVTFGVSL